MEQYEQRSLESYEEIKAGMETIEWRMRFGPEVAPAALVELVDMIRTYAPEICVLEHRQLMREYADKLYRLGGRDPEVVPFVEVDAEPMKHQLTWLLRLFPN